MRIIDKNTDFYDYWQNIYRDTSLTFDRRNSFLLTKELVCDKLDRDGCWNWKTKKREPVIFNYALLQICNTFWLFLIEVTKAKKDVSLFRPQDYNIELLSTWRDFNKPRKLCSFKVISFSSFYRTNKKEEVYRRIDYYVQDVHTNNYKIKNHLDRHSIRNSTGWIEKDIPILKACGIGSCMDAHETYLAFEEYFSLKKSASERKEPIGTTDIDKIESHGFDKKTSFRGKQ